MLDTLDHLKPTDFPSIRRNRLDTLQVNLGYMCNQQCLHCHVDAGPRRTEIMQRNTMDEVIEFLRRQQISTLDLTGGAPEMNPNFMDLVSAATAMGVHVMDRCNLTILLEPGYEAYAGFLAEHQVEIIASMPCYLKENVNAQRGAGVFEKSISALRELNSLGYGHSEKLKLNLVYNPQGPSLPPSQAELEPAYKKTLLDRYGISFNRLFTLVNMPIKRFGSALLSRGEFETYMHTLKSSHRDQNLESVMCKSLVSVDWQGYVYDCDFNQMLGVGLGAGKGRTHLRDLMNNDISNSPIVVMEHCYGCTAGQGSSCGGALS
ncbi:MAG: arsenosugar biosynthesis radical SAM protein ArsS [Thiotrichales bacterium]|nr:MAG: arsenosugar biosynthesis radical SAM protein ArsS [Thiotrichales bacterium]